MPCQFRGLDERGVPRYTGGSEPPELVVWAVLLAGCLLFVLLMCVCAAAALAEGSYSRFGLSAAAAAAAIVILVPGSLRWLDLALRFPYLVTRELAIDHLGFGTDGPAQEAGAWQVRPRANMDGLDLYDLRDLAGLDTLLRPSAPPQDALLRAATPGFRGPQAALVRPTDIAGPEMSDTSQGPSTVR